MTGASLGYDGYYNGTSLREVGIGVRWWASTIRDTENSYNLNLNSSGHIYPQGGNARYVGRAVRCI
ncbi:hypothetical protein IKG12_01600 [Candidatus Saccharibacteria bacterium]|nr:hypothetical protein [Candidatus Saccharibacteria bacterium]MBR3233542.1 hypothetical protein [Candidatus Saccharibacteria bacterium]